METAERLFYAEGVRAVGIDRIIAEAEVAKMTLYNHFASKDDLILAVLQYREAKFDEMFEKSIERHVRRGMDKLEAFFAALKDWFKSPGFRGCIVHQRPSGTGGRRSPGLEVLGPAQAQVPRNAEGDHH